jgi:hypothetical protein
MSAGCPVGQLADVLIPLLRCEASGCGADPVDGRLHVQVPQPDRAVVAAAGQGMPIGLNATESTATVLPVRGWPSGPG